MSDSPGATARPAPTVLRVSRATSYADRLRAYKILVDGQVEGSIKAKETMDIRVAPGTHEVMMKIDWCRSNRLPVQIGEGETVELACGSSLAGWKFILSLIYIIFLTHKYLWLEERGRSRPA